MAAKLAVSGLVLFALGVAAAFFPAVRPGGWALALVGVVLIVVGLVAEPRYGPTLRQATKNLR